MFATISRSGGMNQSPSFVKNTQLIINPDRITISSDQGFIIKRSLSSVYLISATAVAGFDKAWLHSRLIADFSILI
jgi:hypothetical protein